MAVPCAPAGGELTVRLASLLLISVLDIEGYGRVRHGSWSRSSSNRQTNNIKENVV